jgi:imidazolonepropionase-like amidohydrolase
MFAVRHGLPHDRALRAVTLDAARLIGVDDRVGALAPGLEADLVIWNGDPLSPTTKAEAVYIRGQEVTP